MDNGYAVSQRTLICNSSIFRTRWQFFQDEIVTFLGRVGNSRTWDEMVFFLGRDCHFFRTSWYFHKIGTRWCFFQDEIVTFLGRVGNLITWDELVTFLGRDGHRLTNLANLKYWGMHFVIIGGMGSNYWGDIYPPSPPVSAPLITRT